MIDNSIKTVTKAGYLLVILLIVLPLLDTAVSVLPFQFSDERWRFGAMGAVSSIMVVPLLGSWLALVISVVQDHRKTRRVIGWISVVMTAVFSFLFLVFILDYIQARADVRDEYLTAMDQAAIVSLIKQMATIVFLILIGLAGLKGSKSASRSRRISSETEETPLISMAKK